MAVFALPSRHQGDSVPCHCNVKEMWRWPKDNLEGAQGVESEAVRVLGELQEPEGEEMLEIHHSEVKLLEEGCWGLAPEGNETVHSLQVF